MKHSEVEPKTKMIWDSGFGYEIGYFIRVSDDVMYNTVILNLITGSQTGSSLRSKDSVLVYNSKNLKLMYQKYKYWNQFPDQEKIVSCA